MTDLAPLELTPDQMRVLGQRALDIAIRHFETNRSQPVATPMPSRQFTEALLHSPLSELGTDPLALLDIAERDIFSAPLRTDHPRFYAFVPSPTNFVSVLADLLTSAHNVFAGHWLASSTASQIEITVIDWLRELCGLPVTGGGILVSGGSMANLSAIATARDVKLGGPNERAVLYCSDQTHSSLFKGLRILGFTRDQRRSIPTDSHFRLRMDALNVMIADDRAAGRVPFCVVANGGTTNTGAIDPLNEIADLCAREQLWMHVDGAYGAAAVLTERGRTALAGIERADSITLDPHKWLFQPYELGCLLVRDTNTLRATFAVNDDDLASSRQELEERIDAVAPVILVGLGGTATRVLFGRPVPRGRWTDHRGIAFMPTIHPSDLLRDASDKRLVWEDMQAVAERYNEDLPAGTKPAKAKSK